MPPGNRIATKSANAEGVISGRNQPPNRVNDIVQTVGLADKRITAPDTVCQAVRAPTRVDDWNSRVNLLCLGRHCIAVSDAGH